MQAAGWAVADGQAIPDEALTKKHDLVEFERIEIADGIAFYAASIQVGPYLPWA